MTVPHQPETSKTPGRMNRQGRAASMSNALVNPLFAVQTPFLGKVWPEDEDPLQS
jgi:hypothetical protein